MGFNGDRLHQKYLSQDFYITATKWDIWFGGIYQLGYGRVRSEMPGTGSLSMDGSGTAGLQSSIHHWLVSFNETWDFQGRRQRNAVIETFCRTTKAIDGTRPYIDTTGCCHVVTNIFDIHDYIQDPDTFRGKYDRLVTDHYLEDVFEKRRPTGVKLAL